ncbi:MAG: hypothetical protein F6Q13_03605 [Mycobacterium sp.]|nr:MAG: hypothetical protein F6Q13_03605 [Mycobacterium sp.]
MVIGRFPGETSAVSPVWAVLHRASAGWCGLTMTPAGIRLLHDLLRARPTPGTAASCPHRWRHRRVGPRSRHRVATPLAVSVGDRCLFHPGPPSQDGTGVNPALGPPLLLTSSRIALNLIKLVADNPG